MSKVKNNHQAVQANPLQTPVIGSHLKRGNDVSKVKNNHQAVQAPVTECIGWLFDKKEPNGIDRIVRQTEKSYLNEQDRRFEKGAERYLLFATMAEALAAYTECVREMAISDTIENLLKRLAKDTAEYICRHKDEDEEEEEVEYDDVEEDDDKTPTTTATATASHSNLDDPKEATWAAVAALIRSGEDARSLLEVLKCFADGLDEPQDALKELAILLAAWESHLPAGHRSCDAPFWSDLVAVCGDVEGEMGMEMAEAGSNETGIVEVLLEAIRQAARAHLRTAHDEARGLKTILNRVEHFKSFLYGKAKWVEDAGRQAIEVEVHARKNGRAICSGCGRPQPGYDRLPERRFEFVPLWGIAVFFVYAMRRVDCQSCGVTVERVPWAVGKAT